MKCRASSLLYKPHPHSCPWIIVKCYHVLINKTPHLKGSTFERYEKQNLYKKPENRAMNSKVADNSLLSTLSVIFPPLIWQIVGCADKAVRPPVSLEGKHIGFPIKEKIFFQDFNFGEVCFMFLKKIFKKLMCVCSMWTSRYGCSILRVQQGAAILEAELEVFGNWASSSLVLCKNSTSS